MTPSATEPHRPTRRRAIQRVIDGLEDQRDRWCALRTLPRRTLPRRHSLTTKPPVPASELALWHLHIRVTRRGDQEARAGLVTAYEDHARSLARRFHRQREPIDDLVQVALEALLLAIDRFDPSRGMPFLGFANPTITGSLKRYYRDAGWSVRVPRRVHELSRPVREVSEMLSQDLGRTPSVEEIADAMGLPLQHVQQALDASSARITSSLDAPAAGDATVTVGQQLGAPDRLLGLVEDREALRQAVALLDDDERLLLDRYFGQELTQVQIAELMGASQMHVSRSLARVLRRLRSHIPQL